MKRQPGSSVETKRLAAIDHISRTLVSYHKKETALQKALDYLTGNLEAADTAILWRLNNSTGKLVVHSVSGIDMSILQACSPNIGEGMIGNVLKTRKDSLPLAGEILSGTGITNEKLFGTKIKGLNSPYAAACVPLITEKEQYGVLTLLNVRRKTRFASSDLLFFRIIANLLMLSMESSANRKDLKEEEISGSNDPYIAALIPTVAHEMRTPLTSIKGFSTALLMEDISFDARKQREFLEIIDRECDILVDFISNFLESSTIEAGNMKINPQPVRLPRLAEKAVDDVGRRFPQHSLLIDIPDDFPLIDADPERILQILRQLLDNAAKYSPEGGLIVLQGKVVEDDAVISVADEGVGIAPEDLNHLFDRFFRAKSSSGSQVIGTGLGLPISRAIVEAHGGRIWAESQLGQGSKLYFSLPLIGLVYDKDE